jgi:hypothetical protein
MLLAMKTRGVACPVLLVAALAAVPAVPRAQDRAQDDDRLTVTLPLLLGRAAWYVNDFVDRFSNVVAEETYIQDSNIPMPPIAANTGRGMTPLPMSVLLGTVRHRVVRSDFLLATIDGELNWVPFRDVFEVDQVPVRDRAERLTRLFLNPSPDSVKQAERIREESSRYNLGSVRRTINNPMLGIAVLQANIQDRFRFTLRGKDPTMTPDVWIVEYREEQRPTLIKGQGGIDLFSHGRLWIELDTGRLLKSELAVEQANLGGQVTTSYRVDDRFGIAVPADMHEDYRMDDGTRLTAVATYDRFRRFSVQTEESQTLPQ